MKAYRLVMGPAKGPLILVAFSLMLALALVLGLAHYRDQTEAAFVEAEAALRATRNEGQTLSSDVAVLEKHLPAFRHLANIGFIGNPDRAVWVQNLVSIYGELELPPTLRYSLALPSPQAESAGTAGAAPPSQPKVLRHDLDIELSAIHEGEFLTFMDRLRADWQTPFRVETCQFSREPKVGLQIKCTLRLFSLPVKTATQPAGA